MFVSCKINLAGDSCMYMSMQRWDVSIFLSNEFPPAGYPVSTLYFVVGE